MNRTELLEVIISIGIAVLCLTVTIVFIIPAIVCRLVQDRK